MKNYLIKENLERKEAVEYITANGVNRAKVLRMSDDVLATTYDVVKRQAKKSSIDQFIDNGKKMKWKPKRIAETLHHLGFSDKEIDEAM